MAQHTIPPDRDPELRRMFALDAEGQLAALRSMAGESTPAAVTFRHVPMIIGTTPKGGLSARVMEFPEDSVLTADSRILAIRINNDALRSRSAPRTPAKIAELEELLRTAGTKRGIIQMPFQPPTTWTVQTIRAVVALMLKHLPYSDSHTGEFRVRVGTTGRCLRDHFVRLSPESKPGRCWPHLPYSAEVVLAEGAVPVKVIKEWWAAVGVDICGIPLDHIDAVLFPRPVVTRRVTETDSLKQKIDRIYRHSPGHVYGLEQLADRILEEYE